MTSERNTRSPISGTNEKHLFPNTTRYIQKFESTPGKFAARPEITDASTNIVRMKRIYYKRVDKGSGPPADRFPS